jgi:membrane-bound lytic murein transglycosylase D
LASLVAVCAAASPSLASDRPVFARPPGVMWEDRAAAPAEPRHIPTGSEADYMLSTGAREDGGVRAAPGRQVIPYDIPVVYNDMVEDFIRYFTGRGRKFYHKWLSRSSRYMPVLKEVLREYRLPEDTVYLAMIESGFSPYALSKSAAGGIWQFIPETAMRYGLRIDYWRDERRDPVKSTRAAAMYLRDLYEYFGSWWLAWAGYNSGEGKIFRALERFDTDDFWELSGKRFLRKETKQYVPKLIAAAVMSKAPAEYGFDDVEYLGRFDFDEVQIPSPSDLRVIAKAALADLQTIETLNPELRRGCTPANQPTYVIRIPKGSRDRFVAVFSKIPGDSRIITEDYEARRGDTVSGVAKAHGIKPELLAEFNGLGGVKARLDPGTELKIPRVSVLDVEAEERWDKKMTRAMNRLKSRKIKFKYGAADLRRGPVVSVVPTAVPSRIDGAASGADGPGPGDGLPPSATQNTVLGE